MKVERSELTPVEPLLRQVEPARRAECAMDDIVIARRQWSKQHRRPSALNAREALLVLEFEATLVAVAAGNIAKGIALTDADRDRLRLAYRRVTSIVDEVTR